jgi:hypothetical protein
MFNQFLATLDNNPTAPAQFCWPTFTPRVISPAELYVRDAIIGSAISRETLFLRCLLLTDLVAESPLIDYITATDTRLTYTKQTIRNRFKNSGVVVQDTTVGGSPATLSCIIPPTAPESASWTLTMVDSTHLTIVDDLGNSVEVTISFSGGISNTVTAPGGTMNFVFTVAAPVSGNSWEVSYQRAGFSWIEQALPRSQTINPAGIMTPDILAWYQGAPTALDKLAAIVTAIGSQPSP